MIWLIFMHQLFNHKTYIHLCFLKCSSHVHLNFFCLNTSLFSFLWRFTNHVHVDPLCLISSVALLSLFPYFVHFFSKPVLTSLFLSTIYFNFCRSQCALGFGIISFSHTHFPWHSFSSRYFFLLSCHVSFDPCISSLSSELHRHH